VKSKRRCADEIVRASPFSLPLFSFLCLRLLLLNFRSFLLLFLFLVSFLFIAFFDFFRITKASYTVPYPIVVSPGAQPGKLQLVWS
jgi:hypothetical protein